MPRKIENRYLWELNLDSTKTVAYLALGFHQVIDDLDFHVINYHLLKISNSY